MLYDQYSMHNLLNRIKNNKVISGSVIVITGGLLGSFTNYLYHLIVARSLGPKDYGILDSLISLIYLLNVPLSTVVLVITKYVSAFKGQGRLSTIKAFYLKFLKKLLFVIPISLIIFLISTPFVVKFLRLPSPFLYIWIWVSFILGLYSTLAGSFLQGLSKFLPLTIAGLVQSCLRLIITAILLLLGWNLMGAIFPFTAIAVISVFITFYLTKFLLADAKNESIPEKKEIVKYIFPVFLTNISIISLITTDIILARHFLSAESAGYYSALSTLSKIIFFAAVPIVSVLFPTVSESYSANKDIRKTVNTGFLLMGTIVAVAFGIFYFFPEIMVRLLFGEKYSAIIPYLMYFVIGMSFYTFAHTLSNILLALKKTCSSYIVAFFSLSQIIALLIFHHSISNFVTIFVIISTLLFFSLLIYYKQQITEITRHSGES